MTLTNGNGWRTAQWTIVAAIIIAAIGGAAAGWRQFIDLQRNQEYSLRLNEQQNTSLDTMRDAIRAIQEQNARQGDADVSLRERLKEHDDYLKHILERLRALEKSHPPSVYGP